LKRLYLNGSLKMADVYRMKDDRWEFPLKAPPSPTITVHSPDSKAQVPLHHTNSNNAIENDDMSHAPTQEAPSPHNYSRLQLSWKESWSRSSSSVDDTTSDPVPSSQAIRHILDIETPWHLPMTTLSQDECYALARILHPSSKVQLSELNLRGICITSEGAEMLAPAIQASTSLRSLRLQQVDADPGSFGLLLLAASTCVETLVLEDCDLGLDMDVLDHPFTMLLTSSRLVTLRILGCDLQSHELHALAAGLHDNTCLKVLDLQGCGLDAHTGYALQELVQYGQLRTLLLADNCLGDVGMAHLCKGLSLRNSTLERISVRGNQLTYRSCHNLVEALKDSHVKCLDISDNPLGDEGLHVLGTMLSSNTTTVNALFLCNIVHCTDKGWEAFATAIRESDTSTLSFLSLSGNNTIGTRGIASLKTLIQQTHNRLTHLDLSACRLNDNDVAVLSQGLATSKSSLQHLYLSHNQLSNTTCSILSQLMSKLSVSTLGLEHNPMDSNGIQLLVQSLEQNYSLTQLRVNSNAKGSATVAQRQHMQHWLSLNRAGRKALTGSVPARYWPIVLEQAHRVYPHTAVYHLLQHHPHLLQSSNRANEAVSCDT
jgi:Ran GTPase-activating protein (RanGAP) involved in mRNA processing and transport